MRIDELGERRLITEIVLPALAKHQADYLGNDCAVIPLNETQSLLITTDAGPKRPFLTSLGVGTFVDLGHFAATMSLSDIAAMAGAPLALVAAFICPNDLSVNAFEELVDGVSHACNEVGSKYVGGDTNEGHDLRIVTTALGLVDNDRILTRRGAEVGDVVCTSGTIGKALRSYLVAAIHQRSGEAVTVERPHARIEFGQLLGDQRLATACMDMSDGPIASARTIGEMNGVVLNLDLESLEMTAPPLGHLSDTWKELVLNVGGDFELLFTARYSDASTITKMGGVICGSVVASENSSGVRLSGSYSTSNLTPWEHFRSTSTINRIIKELI